jgi:hypothetical protein
MRGAGRRNASRRRIRRVAIIAAVLAGLLAATAATAALTDFSTGVAEVDELIGIEAGRGDAGLPHLRPGPGPASEPLSVRMGDGTYQVVAYLGRDGGVCIVSADRHRGGVRGGFGACPPLEDVLRQIERRGANWHAFSRGVEQRTYQLLVAGEVESARGIGDGDWKILMTPPWTPGKPGARPLRLAVAIDDEDIDVGGDGVQMEEMELLDTAPPRLELTYADGTTRVATFP